MIEFSNMELWSLVHSWTWSTVAILVIFAVLLLLFYAYTRYRRQKGILSKEEVMEFELGRTLPSPPNAVSIELTDCEPFQVDAKDLAYDWKLEVPQEQIKFWALHKVGIGKHSNIYQGKFYKVVDKDKQGHEKPEEVAVKVPRKRSRNAVKSVLEEIKILTFIGAHENILGIVAASTKQIKQGRVYLLTEFCSNATLELYLNTMKESTLTNILSLDVDALTESTKSPSAKCVGERNAVIEFQELLRFACEIAAGMEYLETKNVVHGDICTRNVLLNSRKTVKITNICVARRKVHLKSHLQESLQPTRWQWLAYESLVNEKFTSRSDMWSYAATLYEIFSLGRLPFPGTPWQTSFPDKLAGGERISRPCLATKQLYGAMLACWDLHEENRPSWDHLRSMLQSQANSTAS